MTNLFDAYFSFNTTGSVSTKDSYSAFLDDSGNIIDYSEKEYGVYNKPINLTIHKLLYVKKHQIGLGDIIDYITEKTKIKDLIIYITKGKCGCEARRVLFNKWIKINWYSLKFRDLYVEDYDVLNTIKIAKNNKIKLKKLKKDKNDESVKNMETPKEPNKVNTKQKPVEVEKIKGCGCKNKKR